MSEYKDFVMLDVFFAGVVKNEYLLDTYHAS